MTSSFALQTRTLLRKTGFSGAAVRFLRKRGYERALTAAMQGAICPGDVVWDVGANVGEYSTLFARWCGPSGAVYAFEPAVETVARLKAATSAFPNITIIAAGLSNAERTAQFICDGHVDGATSRVAGPSETGSSEVELTTGNALVARRNVKLPAVIKIDIEGHEYEALQGMEEILAQSAVRHVFIEVHFFILAREGRGEVPAKIETLLKSLSFKVQWVDQSHIHALRPAF
jgi:FkbM family methyltransferase